MAEKERLMTLGKVCKQFRKEHGITQPKIAFEADYAIETVSGFEHGRNNNALLLLQYIKLGLSSEDLKEV